MGCDREYVIDESTPDSVLFDPSRGRGLDLSARRPGYANGEVAEPFPALLLIPRSEWQARIQEQEERKTRISDLCDQAGLTVKDQQQTNYCWANAPVHCVEILRTLEGQAAVSLSPASVAARITGYRNVGGMGIDALRYIVANGVDPSSVWPDNAIDPRYATAAAQSTATRYRVIEWWEGQPRSLDELISCVLRGIPTNLGYDWWGHQVTGVDAAWRDGEVALRIDNSWGVGWGTKGRGILQGRRMLPDDITIPRVALAA